MRKEAKEFCMNNLVALIVDTLKMIYPNRPKNELLHEFSMSKTYELLYNVKTGMWAEGPDSVLEMYSEEIGVHFAYLDD